jgi:hypothetical protein
MFIVLLAIQKKIKNYFHLSFPQPTTIHIIQTEAAKLVIVVYQVPDVHLVCAG